jgi:glutamate-1-semialdehyde 2,1-aminomutase
VLLNHLFEEGLVVINTCSMTISTPMTDRDIDDLVEAMETGFSKIKTMA